jgi:uncharacterized Ntn-hydrolase superfamily protein
MHRLLIALLLLAVPAAAQDQAPDPWFSTFSIIAFDPATSELGVGVQSRAFAAGAAVPFAKPGVGAVATQAAANRLYGPKAIALLEQGLTPAEVVKRITDEDPGRDTRQVAVLDAKGRSAVYTGKHVIDRNHDPKDVVHYGAWAGHVTGKNFSVQGNTLASEAVVKAMADAYEQGTGTMAGRLMAELTEHAAQLARAGQFSEAIAEQKKALAITPNQEQMHYALAQRYAQAGNPAATLAALAEAVKRQPYLKKQAADDPLFDKLRERPDFRKRIE